MSENRERGGERENGERIEIKRKRKREEGKEGDRVRERIGKGERLR